MGKCYATWNKMQNVQDRKITQIRFTMEQLRKALINWNVAPLTVVAILCGLTIWMVDSLLSMDSCGDSVDTKYIALSGLITAMSGILYKMYDRMQRNNKVEEDDTQ